MSYPRIARAALTVSAMTLALTALRADSRPNGEPADVKGLPAQAAQLYADTVLFPQPTRWLEIPWLLDLNEGMRLAKKERRPLLIWVSGDDPLERC